MGGPVVLRSTSDFRPAAWCPGPHAQTIFGSLLRPVLAPPLIRERWETPDGDFIDVDRLSGAAQSPLLVALHGLEGSSRSRQILGFLSAAQQAGWQGLAVNFRSCSGQPNRLPRSYHGGETSDLEWIVTRLIDENPKRTLFCVGASLGGNILLKYLGERAGALPPQLQAAAAISTPFDLARSARAIEKGFARVYMKRLVSNLKAKTRTKLKQFPRLVDSGALESIQTVAEFDELVTAPVHGFKNADDYWSRSSSGQFLSKISRPTLLINAKDDPFFPAELLPEKTVRSNRHLTAEFPECGGHIGFICGAPLTARCWAQNRAMQFFGEAVGKF